MRLIDADRAMEIVRNQGIAHPNAYHLTNYATFILREAPTVDAVPAANIAPVRYGRWIMGTGENGLQAGHRKCSRCGEIVKYGYSLYGVHNFCNYCGADMRGSNDEKVREDRHEAL